MKKAIVEALKLIARLVVLVGIPAVLAALIDAKPQWAIAIGAVLVFIDKVIHKLPNEYNGLLPF